MVVRELPGEPPAPRTRLTELPGRGVTRIWECAGPPGAPVLMLIHGVTFTAELNWGKSLDVLGRLEQQFVNRLPAGLEISLQSRPARADVIGALKRLHPLHEGALGSEDGLGERLTDRRHRRRLYILRRPDQP